MALSSFVRELQAEQEDLKTGKRKTVQVVFDPRPFLTIKQILAHADPTRHRAWPAGRRSGKSTLGQYILIEDATTSPGVATVYLSTTNKRAVDTVWDECKQLSADHDLGGKPNENLHQILFPNRSRFHVKGGETKKHIDRIRGLKRIKTVLLDECFPAGTLVDGRPIESLKVGDLVSAVDHLTGLLTMRRVVRTMSKVTKELVEVRLSDTMFTSTANHPVFVKGRGYVTAGSLSKTELCCVFKTLPNDPAEAGLLHTVRAGQAYSGGDCSTIGTATNSEPDEVRSHTQEGLSNYEREEAQTSCARRQRYRTDEGGTSAVRLPWLEDAGSNQNGTQPMGRVRVSDLLQSGSGGRIDHDMYRGRWSKPQQPGETTTGPEEGGVLVWSRVESVSRVEPGSSAGTTVYNLEVEGSHTYFANGVLVHNCQDWDDELLKYAIGSVILPSLADVEGRLIVCGSGGDPKSYWQTIVRESESLGIGLGPPNWTLYDNPIIKNPDAEIQTTCQFRGVGVDDPSIRREYFAEFIKNTTLQILHISSANLIPRSNLPAGGMHKVIAADFGTVDACAVVVLGWVDNDPHIYLLEVVKDVGLGASEQVRFVREVINRHRVGLQGVVGDGGGLGKALVIDLQQTSKLYEVEPAEKANKVPAMRLLAGDLRNGTILIPDDEKSFLRDLERPEWDPDKVGERIKGHVPDAIDAFLYAYRTARGLFTYEPSKLKPKLTPEQRDMAEAIRMRKLKPSHTRTALATGHVADARGGQGRESLLGGRSRSRHGWRSF